MVCQPSGPADAKIMIVGEAPGKAEEFSTPFVGSSGQELSNLLSDAKITRSACWLTNVFMNRPPGNKFHDEWCVGKREAAEAYLAFRAERGPAWPTKYTWGPVTTGKYVLPEHLPELYRLQQEIEDVKPNLVITMGATPTWALLGTCGIKKIRGTVAESTLVPGVKVLPTWHPAYIQRVWSERVVCLTDLIKAKGEAEFPEIRRPHREIWINPDLDDLYRFRDKYINGCPLLSFDTETKSRQITCITFAPRIDLALAVPFYTFDPSNPHYWPTIKAEAAALQFVKEVLESSIPKLAQNGLYDIQYLWLIYGIIVCNFSEDTMLLHHSIYLELLKDLGFLGSIYTSEASWKLMRKRGKDVEDKKDD